jgi:hypothetical protein
MINLALVMFTSQRNAKKGHSNKVRTGRDNGTRLKAKSGETRQGTKKRDRRGGRQEMREVVVEYNSEQPKFAALA